MELYVYVNKSSERLDLTAKVRHEIPDIPRGNVVEGIFDRHTADCLVHLVSVTPNVSSQKWDMG